MLAYLCSGSRGASRFMLAQSGGRQGKLVNYSKSITVIFIRLFFISFLLGYSYSYTSSFINY